MKNRHAIAFVKGILIVVIAFLNLTPVFHNTVERNPWKIAKIQIETLRQPLQQCARDVGRLPTTAEGLESLVQNPGNLASWNGPYLTKEGPVGPSIHLPVSRLDGGEGEDADVASWDRADEK